VCARQSNTQVTHISMPQRPPPPDGAKNLVLLVLDSCRYDSFMAAKPRIMSQLGEVQRRFSYASWTSPGHFNLLMGLLPHPSPTQIVASDYYKRELGGFAHRLGIDQMGLTDMIPRLWLPDFLRNRLGYSTHAIMSMPILNPHTPLNADFDSYVLADSHNDLRAMIPQLQFNEDRPSFYLLNTGETPRPTSPRISGPGYMGFMVCLNAWEAVRYWRRQTPAPDSIKTNSTSCASARSGPCSTSTAWSRS
jgi:hypothetical protein